MKKNRREASYCTVSSPNAEEVTRKKWWRIEREGERNKIAQILHWLLLYYYIQLL